MIIERLVEFINQNSEHGDFTGGVDDNKIKFIEEELNVKLPKSYTWFLKNYGMGGIYGVEILGYGKSNRPSVVVNTERYRSLGLEKGLVVIENCDEFVYCLDTREMKNEECPVIFWDRYEGYDSKEADNFYEFLYQRFIDAKEDLE